MDEDLESVIERLSEHQRRLKFGKYRGLVTDNADPEGLGRIKADVPALSHSAELPWAMPCLPFAGPGHGLALIPEIGDGVWIEFEAGNLANPVWSGCWWAEGQRPEPRGELARLLATSAGHRILIDEDADEIRLVHPGGAEIVLGPDEISIRLGQCSIRMSATEINLNNGMVKVTTAGASLVNDTFKVGA